MFCYFLFYLILLLGGGKPSLKLEVMKEVKVDGHLILVLLLFCIRFISLSGHFPRVLGWSACFIYFWVLFWGSTVASFLGLGLLWSCYFGVGILCIFFFVLYFALRPATAALWPLMV